MANFVLAALTVLLYNYVYSKVVAKNDTQSMDNNLVIPSAQVLIAEPCTTLYPLDAHIKQ